MIGLRGRASNLKHKSNMININHTQNLNLPFFFFYMSLIKPSKAISVCGVDRRNVNVGVKNEACWFGGLYRVEETSF